MMFEWAPDPAPNVGTIEKTPQVQRFQKRDGSILEGCLRKYLLSVKIVVALNVQYINFSKCQHVMSKS